MAVSMVIRSCVLTLLVLAVVPHTYAQTCNTTLLQAVQATPELQQLAAVIEASGLSDKINMTDNVTVLAPNNAAFNATTGSLTALLRSLNLTLTNVTGEDSNRAASILLYHIIPMPARAAQLVNGQSLSTSLSGAPNLTVSKTATAVTFLGPANNATVVLADIPVCNSIVHIVNRVLLPNSNLSAIPVYNDNSPTPGVGNTSAASSLPIGAWAFALSGALATAFVM